MTLHYTAKHVLLKYQLFIFGCRNVSYKWVQLLRGEFHFHLHDCLNTIVIPEPSCLPGPQPTLQHAVLRSTHHNFVASRYNGICGVFPRLPCRVGADGNRTQQYFDTSAEGSRNYRDHDHDCHYGHQRAGLAKLCSHSIVRSQALNQRPTIPPPAAVLRGRGSSCGKLGTYHSHLYRHKEASADTQHVNSPRRPNLQPNEQRNSRTKKGSNNGSSSTKHNTHLLYPYNISVLTAPRAQQRYRVTASRQSIASPHSVTSPARRLPGYSRRGQG